MKQLLDDVAAFQAASGQKVYRELHERDAEPVEVSTMKLRLLLVAEEFFELLEGHGVEQHVHRDGALLSFAALSDLHPPNLRDMPAVADAIADLMYVLAGMALAYGIPLSRVWDAVHAANMRKFPAGSADVTTRGKIQKPTGWLPPDIEGALYPPKETV